MSPIKKALRRFFYMKAPAGGVKHRLYKTRYDPVEGDLTACGLVINTRWKWVVVISKAATKLKVCRRCDAAG